MWTDFLSKSLSPGVQEKRKKLGGRSAPRPPGVIRSKKTGFIGLTVEEYNKLSVLTSGSSIRVLVPQMFLTDNVIYGFIGYGAKRGWRVGDWILQLHSCYDYYPDAKIGFKHFSSLPNYFQWRRTFFYSSGCANCEGGKWYNTNKILINFKVRQSSWIKRWVHETMVSPKVETKLLIAITIRINIFLISPSIKKQSYWMILHCC